jgi:hypothetical protein
MVPCHKYLGNIQPVKLDIIAKIGIKVHSSVLSETFLTAMRFTQAEGVLM